MINIFNPFEEKYFNKKSIANKEDKNVVIRPTKRGGKPNKKISSKEEIDIYLLLGVSGFNFFILDI